MTDKISDVKIISVSAKCSDMCSLQYKRADGTTYFEHDGYVPHFLGPSGYGDYVQLDIERDTGQILNWKRPTDKDLRGKA